MSSEALSSSDYVSPQTLVDLCVLQGWAAVWVTHAAGSSFQGGHVHVFYREGQNGSGGSRMIWADQRGVQQIEELRRELEVPVLPSKRGVRGQVWNSEKWVTPPAPGTFQGLRATFTAVDEDYSA